MAQHEQSQTEIAAPLWVEVPGDDIHLSANICELAPEAAEKKQACGPCAIFMPASHPTKRNLCFHHLRREYGPKGIQEWISAVLQDMATNGGMKWQNLSGTTFEGPADGMLEFPPHSVLEEVYLDWSVFRRVAMRGITIKSDRPLTGATFESCNLSMADFDLPELRQVQFFDSDLLETTWGMSNVLANRCNLTDVRFLGSRIRTLNLHASTLTKVTLAGTNIEALHVTGGQWVGVDLTGVVLSPKRLYIQGGLRLIGCTIPRSLEQHMARLIREGQVVLEHDQALRIAEDHKTISLSTPPVSHLRVDPDCTNDDSKVPEYNMTEIREETDRLRLPLRVNKILQWADPVLTAAGIGLVATAICALSGLPAPGRIGFALFLIAAFCFVGLARTEIADQ